jgi:hypothetical protein
MKLKNIKIKKYKLIRFYLVKYEAYTKNKLVTSMSGSVMDRLEIGLKKVLLLIDQYHRYNKKILFIGFPYSSNTKILQVLIRSNHIFVPRSVWKSGLIGNKGSLSTKSLNSSYFKKFLEIKGNPHLVVLFNEEKVHKIVPECSKLSIPVIYLGPLVKGVEHVSYLVEGRFVNRKRKNFFQFLIYSILKKSKK